MSVATTTLQVNFVSESAGYANTFGWYNSVTGLGGILFADVEADGRNAPLTAGVSTTSFTVNTSDVGNIQFFLISDGADLNSSSELAGPIKVIQLANGTWAVAQATASGSVVLDHGQPNVLEGAGVNAMFTDTAKNAGGVDYASSVAGTAQTAATLAGDTADGATGVVAWEDLAATRNANGTYSKPGDADYNDAVFKVSIKPSANADTATVSENGPATTINVLANDTDQATGAVLHVSSVNTSGLHGTVTIAADGGSISYNPGSYFQYLAAGQTATETFTYTETDQFGGSATASTTVTIVGANDGPTIASATATGAVIEDGSAAASGTIAFKDVDTTDTHTISAIAGGSGYLGTFTPALCNNSTGDGAGSVTWNFAVANSALQFLAAGQTLTQVYTVTINDGHGGTVAQNVTVTITGSNDGPCITSCLGFGTVTDNGTLTTAGTFGFIDVDVTDVHTVTATALGSGYVGTLTPVVTTDSAGGSGIIAWSYSVASTDIDFLGAGQTAYQVYKVTVNDGHGGTDSQYVTITLNGSNDAPVVTASSNGSVTEIADNAIGENTATLTSNGTVTFVDPDWSDSHTVTVTAQASGYRGTFSASLFADANTVHDFDHDADDVGPGSVKWNFAVNDSSLDFLSAGQTLVQNYNVTIKDNHGASVTQVVSVTLVGTNDAPTITSAVTTGAVNELADGAIGEYVATLSSSGTIGFKDVDLADSHVISVIPAGGGYVGALTAVTSPDSTGTGTGTVNWSYSVLDGTIDYLAAGQKLTQTYTVAIDDGHGGVASKAVTITITGAADVNHAPVIGTGVTSGAIVEDGVVSAGGLISFSDTDLNDTHSVTAIAGGAGYLGTFTPVISDDTTGDGSGSVSWSFAAANATLQFLGAGQTLTQTYTVSVSDGQGGIASKLVTVTITGTNDVPVISGVSTGSVTEDLGVVTGNLVTSGALTIADVDQGQSNFTVQAGTVATYGTFTLAANGNWTYTANDSQAAIQQLGAGQSITDSFTAVSSDGTASKVVTVTINGTNDVPVIGGVSTGSVTEDVGIVANTLSTSGALTIADVDLGQSNFAAQASVAGSNGYGTFTLASNGSWTYTASDSQSAIQQLGAGQSITDSFTAVSSDGTASQIVTVTLNGTNDVPVIGGVAIGAVTEDVGVVTNMLSTGGALTIADVDQGQSNFAVQSGKVANYGTFTLAANGNWTYAASDSQTAIQQLGAGQSITDCFTAVSSDGTASQLVTVTIHGTNDVPVIGGVAIGAVTEDVGVVTNTLSASGALTIADVDQGQSNFAVQSGKVANYGTFTLAANGAWTYAASDGQVAIQQLGAGQSITDCFTAISSDGTANRIVTVTINGTNDVPVIGGVAIGVVTEDVGVVTNTLSTSGALTIADVDQGQSNFAVQSGKVANYGTFTLAANGAWTYAASDGQVAIQQLGAGQSITDCFTAVSSDGTASQLVVVTIHGTNDVPIISGVAIGAVTEDISVASGNLMTSGALTIADVDQGQSNFTAQAGTAATYGTFTLATSGNWTYVASDSQTAIQQLGVGQSITDSFTAVSSDGTASQVVTVTINGTNDVPVISGVSTGSVTEDAALVSGNLVTSGALTIADVDQGQSNFTAQAGTAATYGTFTLAANGCWTYTASDSQTAIQQLGSGQSITDSFTAVSSDGTASQVVTVTIYGTNDVPVIGGASTGSVTEDVGVVSGNLVTSGALTIADVDQGQSNFIAQAGTAATYGTFTLAADGSWTYAASDGQTAIQQLGSGQSITDSFTAVSSDGTASQMVTVTINGTNDVPVIGGVAIGSVTEDVGAVSGNLMTSGALTIADADQGQSNFTAQVGTAATCGTFTLSTAGVWTYAASDSQTAIQQLGSGQSITDSFTAVSSDGTASQVVTVTINGTNDVPVIGGVSTGSVTEDAAVVTGNLMTSGALTIADVDQGQSNFAAQASTAATYGTFTLAVDGSWTYAANNSQTAIQQLGAGQSITDSFTAVSSDGTASQVVTVTVNGTNDVPVISSVSTGSVTEDVAVVSNTLSTSGALTIADVDQAQSSFTAQAGTAATYGTFTLDAAGAWTYAASDSQTAIQQLGAGQSITDSFTAVSSDGTASQIVTVTINGTNDVPVIGGVSTGSVTEDAAVVTGNLMTSGALTIADVDQGQSNFTAQAGTIATYGTFTLAADGSWTYAASDSQTAIQQLGFGQSITDSFTAVSSDGTASQVVTVTINGTNDVPVISGVSAGSVTEDVGVVANTLSTSGALTIVDADQGQSSFAAQASAAGSNGYGTFTLATNGSWSYAATDSQIAIQQLGAGQSITDSFTAVSSDGTASQAVIVTIHGTNDAPVVTASVAGSATADGPSVTLDALANASDVDQNTTLQIVNLPAALPPGVTYDASTHSFTLDPSNSVFDSLPLGQTTQVTVNYGVSDGIATTSAAVVFSVAGILAAPTLDVTAAAAGNEDNAIALGIGAALSQVDPDALLTINVSGVPAGAVLNHGTPGADGSYTLTPAQLAGLALTSDGEVQQFDLTVTATTTDGAATAATTGSIHVTVTPVAEAPSLTAPYFQFANDFNSGNLSGFDVVKFAGTDPVWTISGGLLHEGDDAFQGMLRADLSPADAARAATAFDYSLAVDVLPNAGATGNNGVGLIFGYQDSQNYFRVQWDDYSTNYSASPTYKDLLLERVTAGVSTVLARVNDITLVPDGASASFHLEVDSHAVDGLHVLINGTEVMSSQVTTALQQFGMWARDNDGGVNYDNLQADLYGTQSALSVNEGGTVGIGIRDLLSEVDADSSLGNIIFNGVPSGVTFNHGTLSGGTLTLTPAQLVGLTMTVPDGDQGNFTLDLSATTNDGGSIATSTATIAVTVNPVAEAPTLTAAAVTVNEDSTVALSITDVLSEVDADSSLGNVIITGVPGGVTFNHGALSGSTLTLTPVQLAGLTLTVPDGDQGNFTLNVSATTNDGGSIATSTATLAVTVVPVAEAPGLVISGATPDLSNSANLLPGALAGSIVTAIYAPGGDVNLIAGDAPLVTTNNYVSLHQIAGTPTTFLTGFNYMGSHNWFVDHGINTAALQGGTIVFANGTVGYIDAGSNGTTNESAYIYYRAYQPVVIGNENTAIPLALNSALSEVDPDTTLSINIAGVPAGATLNHGTRNGDGSYTLTAGQLAGLALTPPVEFDGQIQLQITATAAEPSGIPAITTLSVAVTVNPVADAPTLTAAAVSVNERSTVALSITDVLSEVDAHSSLGNIILSGVPSGVTFNHGTQSGGALTLTQAELAGLTMTLPVGDQGNFTLNVSATTNDGGSIATSNATLAVTVNPVAKAPTLTVQAVTVNEGGTAALNITDVVSALDADSSLGNITIDGLLFGTPIPAGVTFNHGTMVGGALALTPADLAGLTMTVPDGEGNFTLAVFAEAIDGSSSAITEANLVVTVNLVPQGPVGGVSIGSLTEDVGVVTGNLITGGALTVASVHPNKPNFVAQTGTAGSNGHGVFALDASGAWTYTASDSQTAIQQLGAGQSITDSFSVVTFDGTGSQLVTVTIHGTNDVPVISGVSTGSVTEDVGLMGSNLATSGALTIADVDQGQSSFIAQVGTAATYGTFSLAANGAWTYTASDSQTAVQQLGAGQSITDSFTAVSFDGTASRVVSVTINGTNDVPVIGGVSIGSVTEDVGLSGSNLATSGALTIADVDQGQSSFIAQGSTTATYGTFTLAANGSWTYTASDSQSAIQQLGAGQSITDSFTAVSSDGTASRVVTVTINGTNDVPVIGGVAIGSVTEDVGLSGGNLVASGALTIVDVDQGQSSFIAQGSATATYGTFTLATNGSWTYAANDSQSAVQQLGAGQSITDSFTAVSSDGTASRVVTVTINGTNDVPVIGGVAVGSVTEDVSLVGSNLVTSDALTIADTDQGQSNFTAQAGTVATYGTFTLATNGAWTYAANDSQTAVQQLGAGQSITDSFTAVSSDGTANRVVTVTINGTNDVPVISGVSSGSVTEDVGLVGGNLATSGTLTIADVDQGQSNFTAQASTIAAYGTFTLAATGAWTYTVNDSQTAVQQLGAGQSITDSFTAVSSDGTASKVVTVTINGTNDVPVIGGVSTGSAIEDVGLSGSNLATNGTLTIADVDQGQSNFTTQASAAGSNGYGTFTLAANGAWTYTASNSQTAIQQLGAGQSITDSFTAVSSDGTASKVVTVTINGTNDVPVIGGVSTGSVIEDVGLSGSNLTTNGTLTIADVDQSQSSFTAQASAAGSNGHGTFTLAANGAWTYTASDSQTAIQQLGAGQSITDSFTALSFDGTASRVVTVTINGTNDVPVISGVSTGSVTEDLSLTGSNLVTSGTLTITDVDQGQSGFVAQACTAATYGTFTLAANGNWAYTANNSQTAIQQLGAAQSLSDSFTAVSSDGTASKVVTVTINGTNDVPVIGGTSTGSVTEDVGLTGSNLTASGSLTIADVDQGQSNFTAQASTSATYGSFTLATNGAWTYAANDSQTAIQQLGAGQSITDSFTAVSSDGTASQVVTVTIHGTNDVPVISGVAIGLVTEDVGLSGSNLATSGTLSIADVDQGQSSFAAQASTLATYGTFTLAGNGAWTYTANDGQTTIQQLGAGQSITDSFTAVSSDGTASQVVTVTIHGTNDVPVISGVSTGSVTEDVGVSGGNLATSGTLTIADADQDQSSFIVQAGTAATYGTFTLAANGSWTYAANDSQTAVQQLGAGQSITDSFTAVSSDGTANRIVTVTINGTNDAPVIGGVAVGSVTEDVGLSGSNLVTSGALTIADVDQGQSNFTAQASTIATYGTFTLATNGSWTYTANDSQTGIQQLGAGQSITDSFTAVSSDGAASQVVTVTIHGTNDVPVISGVSTGSVTEDVGLVGSNLATSGTLTIADADQGQSSFTAQAGTIATYGSFTLATNGVWTYAASNNQTAIQQLGAGQSITDSFTAVSSDGTASQLVTVTIHGTNDVPVISGVSTGSVTEDVGLVGSNLAASGALTIADVDQGQSSFTAQASTIATYGTFTLTTNGNWTYTASNSQTAIQQLGAGQSITDSLTAVSSDGTASQVVTVTIHGTNDVPVISGVSTGSVTEDVGVSGGNLATSGTLTIADVDQGQSNFTAQAATVGSNGYGTFTLAANGAWTYAANDSQTAIQQLGAGQSITDSFTAVSSDGTASRVVTVTINGSNDVPVIGGVSTGSVTEDVAVAGGNLATSGTLTIVDVDQGQSSFIAQASAAGNNGYGTFTLAANGVWTYAANDSQTAIQQLGGGQSITDSFTAVSSDGTANRVVTVTINGTNDVPVISGVSTGSATEDVAVSGGNLATSGTLTIADIDQGQSNFAVQAGTVAAYGTFSLAANGAWTYTANNSQTAIQQLGAGQSITDSFTAVSSDGTASRVVTVTINGTNDVPVIGGVAVGSVTEDVGLSGSNLTTSGALTVADADQGQSSFIAQAGTSAVDGTFTLAANGSWTYAASDSQTAIQQLGAGQSITDSFTAVSSDGTASRVVTVTINGTNDVPVIGGVLTGSVTEDVAVAGGNLATSGTLTIADVDQGQSIFTAQASTVATYGTFTLAANGAWTYAANDSQTAVQQLGAGQSITDSFTAVSSDGTASRVVTVTINGTNDVPVIGGVSTGSVTEDVAVVSGNLATSGALTIADVDQGQSSFAAQAGTVGSNGHGTFTLATNGTWAYTANDSQTAIQQLGASQSITDSFTVVSSDGTASRVVTVTINGTNDAPVAVDDAYATNEDTALVVNAATGRLANDTDIDTAHASLTASVVTGPSHGSLTSAADGSFTYTPTANYNGTDSFTYKTNDGSLDSNVATVNLTVNPVNDAPVDTVPGAQTVAEDTNLSITGLSVSDIDAGSASITTTLSVLHGTLTVASAGGAAVAGSGTATVTLTGSQSQIDVTLAAANNVVYRGVQDFNGNDTLTVVTNDGGNTGSGGALTDTDTVAITVTAVNDAPVNSVPVGQTSQLNIPKVFSTTNANAISISDVDAGAGSETVTLSVLDGTLTLSGIAGLSFVTGDGTADATMKFSGTVSAINTALNGLTYTSTTNFLGTDTLTITTSDNGNSGSGGALTDTDTMSILMYQTFQNPVTIPVTAGSETEWIVPTDLNGDGKLDLAIANFNASNVSVLLGNGNGTFGAPTNFALPANASSWVLALGDFNGDGKQDIAVTDLNNSQVDVLLGNGNGTFGAATSFAAGGTTPHGIVARDFNGDGKLDIALANESGSVTVLLGTGTGTFGAATSFAAGSTPWMLASGDFNGDGKLDLVTTNQTGNNVSLLLGNGNGTFGTATTFAVGSAPRGIATGDFNGDGKLDLVVSNVNSNTVSVLLGTGTGSFAPAVNYTVGSGPVALAVSDFNGDGKADIAVTNGGGGTITLLFGNGNGTFAGRADFTIGNTPRGIAVADYNGDGKSDLLVANLASDTLSILLHNPTAPGPAGVAGHAIGLGLSDMSDMSETASVTVSGVPTGWSLNAGSDLGNGAWAVQASDLGNLAITSSSDFAGAMVLGVTETWLQSDGTPMTISLDDNVEVYQPGSPVFAWAGQDWLSGSGANDLFVFAQPIGNDTIYNFNAASDQVDLIGFDGMANFQDVLAHTVSDPNGNAVINLGSGQTITLLGVDQNSLVANDFVFDQVPVTSNPGSMLISDGATLPLDGTIDNSGTIALNSTGDATSLQIGAGALTLQGGGNLTLSDSDQNFIGASSAGTMLVNLDNTISGAGHVGDGSLTLVNDGTINATGSNALVLDTGDNAIVNHGTLETAGGTLIAQSAVTGGGNANINGGTIEFGAASDVAASFGAGTVGTLRLDQSSSFSGTVAGLDAGDTIDFADMVAGSNATLGYTANGDGSGGTLSVGDGSRSAQIALLGNYIAASFVATSDGHGGTSVVDTQPANQNNPLAPPQH